MKLVNCENPQRVYNKYLGEHLYVPCGKCYICKNTRNSLWVGRLMQEMLCHKYTSFIFLSYDSEHIPTMKYNDILDMLICERTGEFVDTKDIPRNERNYLRAKKYQSFASKRDFQLFIKRFRHNFKKLADEQNEENKVRYYLVQEYGPTTLRSHGHGLLFYDSDVCFRQINEIISKSWQNGYINSSPARDTAPAYVAKYLNCIASNPSFLESDDVKSFKLCSKHPPIGSLQFTDEKNAEITFNGITETRVFDKKCNEYLYVPLLRSIEDKLFPKIPRFNKITSSYRDALLRNYSKLIEKENLDYYEFQQIIFDLPNTSSDYNYFNDVLDLYEDLDGNYHGLHQFYNTCKKVNRNKDLFGCSSSAYIQYIENYYKNKGINKLKYLYDFEKEYIETDKKPLQDLVLLDLEKLRNLSSRSNRVDYRTLHSFGYSTKNLPSSRLEDFKVYNDSVINAKYIAEETTKNKAKNDFLDSHPYERELYNILIDKSVNE